MLLFSIFLMSAVLAALGLRSSIAAKLFKRGPQREGAIFVAAVIFAAGFGWLIFDRTLRSSASGGALPYRGLYFLALVAGVYFFAALRRRLDLPIWLLDIFLILASAITLFLAQGTAAGVLLTPLSSEGSGLEKWAAPLTILWMWLIARMTAAMNRAPQVTGGYLGIIAVALLILLKLKSGAAPFFPTAASAALAGAGLMTVPLAIRRASFNLGWSASLACGFLLAQIATIGLLKNELFFMVLLSLIAFGLPLLDVTFFRLRAALRGKQIKVDEQRLRLHEALERRGVALSKISLLYLVIAAWLCGLGVFTAQFLFSSGMPFWVFALRAIVLLLIFCLGFIMFFSLARVWMRRGKDEIIPEDIEAFGVRISPVSMSEAMDKIEGFIQSKTPHHVVTSDANAILRAQEDEEYAGILRRAALITPDGFGVIWGARLLNLPVYERVTGVDMVTGICERAAKNNYSIYILGSEPGIAAKAAEKLSERYPGLNVVGTQHGFWKQDGISDEEIVQRIHDAKPDVLFVAFGIPSQEKFIARHFEALNVPVSLGVGGSFDVYSEKLQRAPEYIQRSGMEWLYRVWQEPWRWKRMSYVPRFMAFALRTWLFGKTPTTKN